MKLKILGLCAFILTSSIGLFAQNEGVKTVFENGNVFFEALLNAPINENNTIQDESSAYKSEATIFSRYPWLLDYVDPDNCDDEKITVYNFVIGIELHLETTDGSYIFYDDGFPACTPSDEAILMESCPSFLFRDLSNVVESWECGGITTFNETVDDVIKANSDLSFFSIATTQFATDLSTEGPFTVFAPINNALTSVYPDISIFGFIDPPSSYVATIDNHVVEGVYLSTDLFDGQILTSLSGKELVVSINDNGVFINGAQVILADNETTNGVVHVIDKVLRLEPILVDYPWLESVINFTECTNETVSVYQSGSYLYVYIEDAESNGQLYTRTGQSFCIDAADFSCIDAYRLSTVLDSWTCSGNTEPSRQTVLDIIVESDVHTTLEAAIIAAGLAETLNGEQNFTIFAPTDAAFAALPEGTLDALLADPAGELTQILLYHVLGFSFQSKLFTERQILETVNGAVFIITVNDNDIFINDAKVTVTDIVTSNGVVHVIDAVLLPSEGPQSTDLSVYEVIAASDVHYALTSALITAGLNETLSGEGSFTVFAPVDKSVGSLPIENGFTILTSDGDGDLRDVLLYHVLDGQITSTSLSDGQTVATLNGANIEVSINDDGIFINDAQVTTPDIVASNGVIHVIDSYLLPPGFSFDPPPVFETYDWLSSIVDQDNCSNTKVTVYASGISRYVYIESPNGQTLYTDFGTPFCTTSSAISCADAYSLNITPIITSWTCPDYVEPSRTVVDVIVESENHTSLENAVITAGLAETLSGEGPFTVFAPTDDAFRALPPASVGALFVNASGGLTDLLLYHVLGTTVLSTDLSDGQIATTLNGADIKVSITDAGVLINDALVTVADIETDNGVVHVIDAVLLPPPPEQATVFDIIANSVEHNILEESIKSAGLSGTLSGEGQFTVFAPTDEAFVAIPENVLTTLLSDPAGDLTDILLYHVLGAEALSTSLTDQQTATTLNGADIKVTINDNGIFINDAQVTIADIVTDNGVVHVIDAVLLPPTEPEPPVEFQVFETYNWLGDVVNAANCTSEKVTVYQSGSYQNIYVVKDGNGTLYTSFGQSFCTDAPGFSCVDAYRLSTIIDSWTCPNYVEPQKPTVLDVIVESEVHNTLETVVNSAGLAETLSGEGPFTVFAPTDEAFAVIPPASFGALAFSGALTDILTYHVLGASVLSSDLSDGQTASTVNGEDIRVSITEAGIFINDAQVTVADIVTGNGVVHVIDAVLLPSGPPATTVFDVIENSAFHNILESAIITADLEETLSGDGPFTVFAPTDEAFVAVPEDILFPLLADPVGDILLYHVLGAEALSTSLTDQQTVATINGNDIRISINQNGIFINDAQVTIADIVTENGVVHVIDAVLLPKADTELPQELIALDWLNDIVDFNNCGGSSVELYDFGNYSFVYVTQNGSTSMYLNDGTFYCTSSASYNCKSLYGIDRAADVTWSCSGGNVEPPATGGGLPQELNTLNWLNNIIDFNDCAGSSIELYDFGGYSFVYITQNGQTTMYLDNGTYYCANAGSYNCKSLYGINQTADISWNCSGGNKSATGQTATYLQKSATDFLNFPLYPNPTTGFVYLDISDKEDQVEQINFYDSTGKIILTHTIYEDTSYQLSFNLNNQAKGLYLVEIITKNTRATQKLIVE